MYVCMYVYVCVFMCVCVCVCVCVCHRHQQHQRGLQCLIDPKTDEIEKAISFASVKASKMEEGARTKWAADVQLRKEVAEAEQVYR
jgi:hypothetical protein